MQHVIIGAGPAGVVAAETIRKADPKATIRLFGDEPEPPYSRMAIPYYLSEKVGERGSYLRDPVHHFAAQRIELVQDRVERVDTQAHQLQLADGQRCAYDKLLIATGSRPISPPIPGINLPQVHACWTLADARRIIELAQPKSKVVLVGAGFIGCILLESLVKRGTSVTVIETGNRMVPRMLDERAGGLLKSWCQDRGIDVRTSCSVQSIQAKSNELVELVLADGATIEAALVITATGVKANTDLVTDTNIAQDSGILVDLRMQTNVPDVYAAGDVAQGIDFSTGEYQVQAIQPTATDHGRIAGINMAGGDLAYHGTLNMNVLDTVGLVSCSFGLWMGVPDGTSAERYHPEQYQYINLQFEEDRLIGASSVGKTQHIGILRGLIESRVRLGRWHRHLLDNPTELMQAYIGCQQALS